MLTRTSAIIALCLIWTTAAWSQSPFQFNFQAVARNLAGNPLTNQSVDFRLSVLQGAMDGTAVYVEEQPATTNNFGLANLLVGSGTPALGSLSAVDWANGPYFLQIELDIQNGEGYQLMGTSALASVPYALHAKSSEQAGPEGPQGEPGEQGEAGAGVSQVEIINDSLWLTLTTGEIQNAGRVVPALDSLLSSIGVLSSGGGCNPRFPEGYGTFIHHTILTTDPGYTVPDGYNLYVIGGGADGFTIDQQDYLTQGANWGTPTNPLIVPSGALYREDIIGTTIDVSFRGWLVPVSSEVEVVYIYLDATDPNEASEFVVPDGKEFVLLRAYAWDGTYEIDGVTWDLDGTTSDWYLNFPSGSRMFDPGVGYLYGYLVNEGYFENCSGSSVGTSAGADGQSAYELWLSLGNEGSEEDFLASLVGPQGEPGPGSDSAQERLHIEFAGDAPTNVWSSVSDTYAISAGEYYRLNANTPYTYVSGGGCTAIWFRLWDVDNQQVLDISAVRENFIYNSGDQLQIQLYSPPVPLHTLGVCGASNTFQLAQFQEFYLQANQDANVELQWRIQSAQVFSWPETVKVRGTLSQGW